MLMITVMKCEVTRGNVTMELTMEQLDDVVCFATSSRCNVTMIKTSIDNKYE